MDIKFEKAAGKHVQGAVELAGAALRAEKLALPILPGDNGYPHKLRERVAHLFIEGAGAAAVSRGEIVGYLAGYKVDEMFGECKGIYSPLYGHGVSEGYNKQQLYQKLYQAAAEQWVKAGYLSHGLTLYAHDQISIDTLFRLGFGLRCVDAVRGVKENPVPQVDMDIRKIELNDISSIAELHSKHNLYYRNSPIFMPNQVEDPIKDLTEWIEQKNRHLWAAYMDGSSVGYMRIEPTGETFISQHPQVMNITGAYVTEKFRDDNVASSLLAAVEEWLEQHEYRLLGVDYESLNILASNFWGKYFNPYTYSVVRRIDERILNFDQLNKER
ncbi:MAG: GNAT family N-acetyltransferase [Bacillota bacterium]